MPGKYIFRNYKMDILREEFYRYNDLEERPILYYQLDITDCKGVFNVIEPDICCNLYSCLYSDAD